MARVLICDDAEFMRSKIREYLTSAGHTIAAEASSVSESVELYKEKKPDIVTMDIFMKELGVVAIKEIRKFDPQAKIVIVSVLQQQAAEVIDAIRAGAKGLVTKPIRKEEIISEVERVLSLNN